MFILPFTYRNPNLATCYFTLLHSYTGRNPEYVIYLTPTPDEIQNKLYPYSYTRIGMIVPVIEQPARYLEAMLDYCFLFKKKHIKHKKQAQ